MSKKTYTNKGKLEMGNKNKWPNGKIGFLDPEANPLSNIGLGVHYNLRAMCEKINEVIAIVNVLWEDLDYYKSKAEFYEGKGKGGNR